MKTEVNPQDTNRAEAFELWMSSPMPMVTLTKTFDVSNLIRMSRRLGVRFNALLCWCIGKAATQSEEFYILPENGKLFKFDCIAINVIVNNSKGGINSCDIPFTEDLKTFLYVFEGLALYLRAHDERPLQRISQPDAHRLLLDYALTLPDVHAPTLKQLLAADFAQHEHKNPPSFLQV